MKLASVWIDYREGAFAGFQILRNERQIRWLRLETPPCAAHDAGCMDSRRSINAGLALGAWVSLAAACSCGSIKPGCLPSTCNGCCDSTGACLGGHQNDACGSNASACSVCVPGLSCQGGKCLAGQ